MSNVIMVMHHAGREMVVGGHELLNGNFSGGAAVP